MSEPLRESELFPEGALSRLGSHVDLLAEVMSTNAYLLARAAELPDGAVALAEFQTAGRGRQGRRWLAPRGSSILLSILLFEPVNSPRLVRAALLAALAAAQAVEGETSCRPALRWPNDLIAGGKKLGGVLAESTPLSVGGRSRRVVVVGVGLNCLQQAGHFLPELEHIATSLELQCLEPVDRAALARALLERLDVLFSTAPARQPDWPALHDEWVARCADLGKRVTLVENSREFTGTVLEIADNGDLIVQLEQGGRRRFDSATTTRIQ